MPIMKRRPFPRSPAARNEIEDQDDDGNDQEQVNQPASDMTDKTQQPKDEQDNNDGIEHDDFSLRMSVADAPP
jgi:hypothetical protein